MAPENHSQVASFIWSICNLLRGPYKRNEYRKVILPLTVLRRFDCILEPTKSAVLKEHSAIKAKGENIIRNRLSQIREKATNSEQVVKLRQANPFDKFQLGLRQLLEDLMIQRMTDNDKIVTRYMDDKEFGDAAFGELSKSIYESIPVGE